MSTFSSKGTDIDVEAIMANIRRKIEEKRKGFYTEDEVREIAEMKLDAVLDANEFNSDFVALFRARDERWNYRFDPETIYASSHAGGGGLIRATRRLLNPLLKLFFNPNPIISALSRQADLNRYYVLLLHNMAQELTRSNLELTNLKARLRTLGIRVDFQTKREKTMEQVVLERETRESRALAARSSDRPEPSERPERSDRGGYDRGERERGPESRERGDRPERGERDRGDRERGERDRGDREGRGRGRGRRSFRRRRGGGGGGGGNRSDSSGRPSGGNRPGGGGPSGPREGSGGNRS